MYVPNVFPCSTVPFNPSLLIWSCIALIPASYAYGFAVPPAFAVDSACTLQWYNIFGICTKIIGS